MSRRFLRYVLLLGLFQPLTILASTMVDTQSLRLHFSQQGDLLRAEACFPDCRAQNARVRLLSAPQGMLVFTPQDTSPLDLERKTIDGSIVLSFTDATGKQVRRWQIPEQGWLISVAVQGVDKVTLMSGEQFRPAPASGFGNLLEQSRYLFFEGSGDAVSGVTVAGLDETERVTRISTGWFGFRNRFWTVMMLADTPLTLNPKSGAAVKDAWISAALDGRQQLQLGLYLGPVEPVALHQAAPELENLMYAGLWFWLRWICQALYYLLGGIATFVPQWGLAIMLLSAVVGMLMQPLNKIADRLQGQVQAIDARLGPKLAAIKKRYKGSEQSERILTLYKDEDVHPLYSLKGLLGVVLIIPVFIGAFDMLAENIHLSGASFLWIADLSHADAFMQLPFSLPFFGGDLNLLPFIMTGFSFIASKLHAQPALDATQQRKHRRNLVLMSLGFLILFYTFPAGMVLYWTTNNLISVGKTLWKRRSVDNN